MKLTENHQKTLSLIMIEYAIRLTLGYHPTWVDIEAPKVWQIQYGPVTEWGINLQTSTYCAYTSYRIKQGVSHDWQIQPYRIATI